MLWETPLTLHISMLHPQRFNQLDSHTRQALQRALEDIGNGWLPLGANGSRGLGVFTDITNTGPQWSDQGQWINGAPTQEAYA